MGTGPLPVSDQGLFPAEHRALRELHAMTRQLGGHWSRLGERVGGEAARCWSGARRPRASCSASSTAAVRDARPRTASRPPRASAAAPPGVRGVSDLLLERNQALRSAVLDMTHVTLLLGYLAELAERRDGTELAALHRRWEARLREIEDSARALAVAEGRPERAIEPPSRGRSAAAVHGPAVDGRRLGRAHRAPGLIGPGALGRRGDRPRPGRTRGRATLLGPRELTPYAGARPHILIGGRRGHALPAAIGQRVRARRSRTG